MTDSPGLPHVRLNGRTVDLRRGSVTDEAGQRIALRPQAAEVLKVLVAKAGQVVPKDDLIAAVWGGIAVTDDSLVQCIAEIRKALADESHEIIRTLPKRGYVIETGLMEDGGRAGGRSTLSRYRSGLAIASTMLVLLAALAAYLWPVRISDASRPAIAVLPFDNLSGEERWNRFATGLTDDIITDLARFRDIPVIARTSAEVYGGEARDVREVGKHLNVDYVLEGGLQVDGHRMRVTAQLINTATGAHVWSERYDRDAADFFAIQDEITQKIATTLTGWQGQLAEAERALTRRKNATDLDAYDYWLLGIEAKHRLSPQGEIEARAYFDKGLKLAPNFMPLLRDFAITHVADWEIGSPVDFPSSVEIHRRYIERALALDPNDATTNMQMGVAYAVAGDEERSEYHMNRALALSPNNADILMLLAWTWAGWRTDRAMGLVERTLKLDPRHPSWWNFPIAYANFAARRFDRAYIAAGHIGESPNQAAFLAMSAAQLGKAEEARKAAARVLQLRADWTAESMFPYPGFQDEALLHESALKAGLPVCMTAAQSERHTGVYRSETCAKMRMQTSSK